MMKKSTLLYLALNAAIMLTPILFFVGMRYKIATGQIVDLKAQAAARYKNISFQDIHEIEVSSSKPKYRLSVTVNVMDSINNVEMDTTTFKYITYSFKGDKLSLHYDYEKDSLDNSKKLREPDNEEYYDYVKEESGSYRSLTIYVKSNISAIKATNATVNLDFQNREHLISDLNVYCDYSTLNLSAPYIPKPRKEEESESDEDDYIPYTYNHHLTLQLHNYSDVELSYFGYIKTFDLEIKDESRINHYPSTGAFNLSIDKKSVFMMDVNDLDQVKIKYE